MGVDARDFYLILPQLSLGMLGLLLIFASVLNSRSRETQVIGLLGLLVPLLACLSLWSMVDDSGAETAFGGALVVDKFSLFFALIVVGAVAWVFLAAREYLERFSPHDAEMLALMLFSASGLSLLASAADLLTIYVSLELASLPVVALVAFGKTERSTEAGIKYLLLSALSSAILLFGFAYLYGATGTLQVVDAGTAEPTISDMIRGSGYAVPFGTYPVLIGAVMATAGFGFKLSIVPFQMWTPDVYEGAPTPVAGFLAVASKAAAFAVVIRLFHEGLGELGKDWSTLFAVLAGLTMTVGNLVAISQTNLKRLLGYSAIAHAGYVLVGLASMAPGAEGQSAVTSGAGSALFYLAGYALTNLTAFGVVIIVITRVGGEDLDDLSGMGRRIPFVAFVLSLTLISLIGIPPMVGFMGKLFVFNAAVDSGLAWLALLGVINSVISAYYYLNVLRIMYFREPRGDAPVSGPKVAETMAAIATGSGMVIFGIWPSVLIGISQDAARSLIG